MSEFDDKDDLKEFGSERLTEDEMFSRSMDEDEDAKDRTGLGITDFVRKKLESTMDQVQTTGSLSKEALSYVIQQGDKGRKEVLRIVAQEVGDFLKNTDLSQELTKVLTGMKIDVNASIAFRAVDEGRSVKPEIEKEITLSGDEESEESES